MNARCLEWEDVDLRHQELEEARKLISTSPFQWQRFLEVPGADLTSLTLADISTALTSSGGILIASRVEGILAGFVLLASLPWESGILHRKMSVLKHLILNPSVKRAESVADHLLQCAIRRAVEQSTEFLMCKVFTDDQAAIHALERHGFLLVETALNFAYEYSRAPLESVVAKPNVTIRYAEAADIDSLATAGRAAFHSHIGRFHSDPLLVQADATLIYEEWLRSSLLGYADAIFVAEHGAEIAGFSVWKNSTPDEVASGMRSAHYSIGGVTPKYRNQGLFRALTLSGMHHYREQSDLIEGPTNLRNSRVQRAYASLGWEARDSQYTFHRWL